MMFTARPRGEAGLVNWPWMTAGVEVLAAATTSAVQGPLAAPAFMKQLPPEVPQKQFVPSPETVQVDELRVKHFTTASQRTWSAALPRPQQPSVPAAPSEHWSVVQVPQVAVPQVVGAE